MHIGICEDDIKFLRHEEEVISKLEVDDVILTECFSDSKDFLLSLSKINYDIILLDIEMPFATGFDVADTINKLLPEALIVFVSSYEQFAVQGYKFKAFRFIKKSDFDKEIGEVIRDAKNEIAKKRISIYLKYKSREYTLLLSDIIYVVSLNNYITIQYNNEKLKFRKTMKEVREIFLSSSFVFANRGLLVNCKHIIFIDGKKSLIYLDNGEHIKASEQGKKNISKKMLEEL